MSQQGHATPRTAALRSCNNAIMARPAKPESSKQRPDVRLHRSIDVPQANRLENIRQLAAAVRDGVHLAAALQELLNVDARHFAYYRQAAIILGVLKEDG